MKRGPNEKELVMNHLPYQNLIKNVANTASITFTALLANSLQDLFE